MLFYNSGDLRDANGFDKLSGMREIAEFASTLRSCWRKDLGARGSLPLTPQASHQTQCARSPRWVVNVAATMVAATTKSGAEMDFSSAPRWARPNFCYPPSD